MQRLMAQMRELMAIKYLLKGTERDTEAGPSYS